MEIEKIIYETTRDLLSIEDKLRIATIFLFCEKISGNLFANLLYTDNHETFIRNVELIYSEYDIDLTIRLSDKNIKKCFNATLEKVKEKEDKEGYYKALFEGDPFAVAIDEIVNYDFNAIELKKLKEGVVEQLEIWTNK